MTRGAIISAQGRFAAGGEIFVLNSADYGPVTINKAVSITSEGAAAGILATSGAAITMSPGASDFVNLRKLTIDGANPAPSESRSSDAFAGKWGLE